MCDKSDRAVTCHAHPPRGPEPAANRAGSTRSCQLHPPATVKNRELQRGGGAHRCWAGQGSARRASGGGRPSARPTIARHSRQHRMSCRCRRRRAAGNGVAVGGVPGGRIPRRTLLPHVYKNTKRKTSSTRSERQTRTWQPAHQVPGRPCVVSPMVSPSGRTVRHRMYRHA